MRLDLLGQLSQNDWRFSVKLCRSGPDQSKRIVASRVSPRRPCSVKGGRAAELPTNYDIMGA